MLPLALFGHGILQLLSGPVLGPASSLFVYGVLSAKQGAIGPAALDVPAPAEFDNGDGLRAMRRADVSFGRTTRIPKGALAVLHITFSAAPRQYSVTSDYDGCVARRIT